MAQRHISHSFVYTVGILAKRGIFACLAIASITTAVLFFQHTAQAAPVVGFNAGRIIEDSVFTNTSSMTISQIQTFLNSKVPTCDTWGTQPSEFGGGTRRQWAESRGYNAPFTCLKDYTENGLTSAQIIYNVAQQYRINPQVLIVLLQKEQGLVTDTWPLPRQYQAATGYGCPDTAPCNTQYYGLTNQISWSSKMFRAILDNSPNWYTPYKLGTNYIRWSPTASCGGSNVYIENRSTQALYNYTPYQPNQSALNAGYGTGDSCGAYGNRNFYLYFRDWFGYNSGPAAFKSASSSTIYVPIQGYKFSIPSMASLQDYGISPDAIQTVNQSYVDAYPNPEASTNYSASISHVIKSPQDSDEDGGSIYLMSRGKRYQFQSMQQFFAFGFKESDISYLPLSYIFSVSGGGSLSNFVSSPYGSLFKVDTTNKTKQVYFEYSTYAADNPSDQVTPLSYYLADMIPSGNPITSRPVMIQGPSGNTVNLYSNGAYYSIPDYDTLSCWGLNTTALNTPTYRTPQEDYIKTISPIASLSCAVRDGSTNYILAGTTRYTYSGLTLSSLQTDSVTSRLLNRIPTSQTPLKSYLKTSDSSAVWYASGTTRRIVPSYNSFELMGLTSDSLTIVPNGILQALVNGGIKLADGQLVKTPDNPSVYVVSGSQRVLYDSSDLFEAYGNDWGKIETYTAAELDAYYPYTGNRVTPIFINKSNNNTYLIGGSGCYVLSGQFLTDIGRTASQIATAQSYDISIFPSLKISKCGPSTPFVKLSSQSLVYWISGGQKHALNTYSSMLSKNGGVAPQVMNVGSEFLNSLTTGQSYN